MAFFNPELSRAGMKVPLCGKRQLMRLAWLSPFYRASRPQHRERGRGIEEQGRPSRNWGILHPRSDFYTPRKRLSPPLLWFTFLLLLFCFHSPFLLKPEVGRTSLANVCNYNSSGLGEEGGEKKNLVKLRSESKRKESRHERRARPLGFPCDGRQGNVCHGLLGIAVPCKQGEGTP